MSKATVGLFVPLNAKSDKGQAVSDFLVGGKSLADAEPATIQWYGVKFSDNYHAIFDTFAAETGRDTHLNGQVAAALMANASSLLATGPTIDKIDIVASLIRPGKPTAATVGVHVPLVAKPEKAEAVKQFLISALPLVDNEPETLQWFAYRKSETEFGIFDTMTGESGRDAHLGGKVAAALMANASELLATPPDIQKFDVLAVKIV